MNLLILLLSLLRVPPTLYNNALGSGDQGILFEHREGTFGDNVNITEVGFINN